MEKYYNVKHFGVCVPLETQVGVQRIHSVVTSSNLEMRQIAEAYTTDWRGIV